MESLTYMYENQFHLPEAETVCRTRFLMSNFALRQRREVLGITNNILDRGER